MAIPELILPELISRASTYDGYITHNPHQCLSIGDKWSQWHACYNFWHWFLTLVVKQLPELSGILAEFCFNPDRLCCFSFNRSHWREKTRSLAGEWPHNMHQTSFFPIRVLDGLNRSSDGLECDYVSFPKFCFNSILVNSILKKKYYSLPSSSVKLAICAVVCLSSALYLFFMLFPYYIS